MTHAETPDAPVATAARTAQRHPGSCACRPAQPGFRGRTSPAFSVSHVPRARGVLRSSPGWYGRSERAPRACGGGPTAHDADRWYVMCSRARGTARARPPRASTASRCSRRERGRSRRVLNGCAHLRLSAELPCTATHTAPLPAGRPTSPRSGRDADRPTFPTDGATGFRRIGHVSRRYAQTITGRHTSPQPSGPRPAGTAMPGPPRTEALSCVRLAAREPGMGRADRPPSRTPARGPHGRPGRPARPLTSGAADASRMWHTGTPGGRSVAVRTPDEVFGRRSMTGFPSN